MVDLIDKLTNEEKQDVKQIKVDKNSALHQMIKAYELGLELYQEPNIIHIYEIGNFLSKKICPTIITEEYHANDIQLLCLLLKQYEEKHCFEYFTGDYLSEIINHCKDQQIIITSNSLKKVKK